MSKKILLTDDDRDLVEAMKLRFESDGYEVVTAYNGEECVEQAGVERPDLIIMDVAMPKMDGFTAFRILKKSDSLKNIPTIILSGKDQMEDIFRMEGVKDYLLKPFGFNELSEMIKKALGDA